MNVVLWIAQILVALLFLAAGGMKLSKSRQELLEMGERMGWAEDFSDRTIKFIGVVELAGALGLILPGVTGIAPALVPVAAAGLGIVFALAAIVHIRRSEPQALLDKAVVIALAIFIVWGRFGDYPL